MDHPVPITSLAVNAYTSIPHILGGDMNGNVTSWQWFGDGPMPLLQKLHVFAGHSASDGFVELLHMQDEKMNLLRLLRIKLLRYGNQENVFVGYPIPTGDCAALRTSVNKNEVELPKIMTLKEPTSMIPLFSTSVITNILMLFYMAITILTNKIKKKMKKP